ncbi:MAG: hypothetical protein ABR596_01430 [Halarsenatibacteraceae bacterium]
MKQKLFIMIIAIILVILAVPAQALASSETETLAILHTNNENGASENLEIIASYRDQLKAKYDNVFLLSAGGALADPEMVQAMNQAGYDALNIGTTELASGQERLQQNLEQAEFPFLSANIDSAGSYLQQPEPYLFLETASGRTIAVLGLIEITEFGIPPVDPGLLGRLKFTRPFQAAASYSYLAEVADIYIGLCYLGHAADRNLARARGEFDLIIGGQSKTVIKTPPLINNVLITQAGSDLNYLGQIIIELDKRGQIISREAGLIEIEGLTKNK